MAKLLVLLHTYHSLFVLTFQINTWVSLCFLEDIISIGHHHLACSENQNKVFVIFQVKM